MLAVVLDIDSTAFWILIAWVNKFEMIIYVLPIGVHAPL